MSLLDDIRESNDPDYGITRGAARLVGSGTYKAAGAAAGFYGQSFKEAGLGFVPQVASSLYGGLGKILGFGKEDGPKILKRIDSNTDELEDENKSIIKYLKNIKEINEALYKVVNKDVKNTLIQIKEGIEDLKLPKGDDKKSSNLLDMLPLLGLALGGLLTKINDVIGSIVSAATGIKNAFKFLDDFIPGKSKNKMSEYDAMVDEESRRFRSREQRIKAKDKDLRLDSELEEYEKMNAEEAKRVKGREQRVRLRDSRGRFVKETTDVTGQGRPERVGTNRFPSIKGAETAYQPTIKARPTFSSNTMKGVGGGVNRAMLVYSLFDIMQKFQTIQQDESLTEDQKIKLNRVAARDWLASNIAIYGVALIFAAIGAFVGTAGMPVVGTLIGTVGGFGAGFLINYAYGDDIEKLGELMVDQFMDWYYNRSGISMSGKDARELGSTIKGAAEARAGRRLESSEQKLRKKMGLDVPEDASTAPLLINQSDMRIKSDFSGPPPETPNLDKMSGEDYVNMLMGKGGSKIEKNLKIIDDRSRKEQGPVILPVPMPPPAVGPQSMVAPSTGPITNRSNDPGSATRSNAWEGMLSGASIPLIPGSMFA